EGEEVLIAVSNGPWRWIDADGEGEEVTPRRPDEAGELVAVVTALREYVIVRWESLRGDGEFLAFHDSRSGEALGGSEIAPDDLEGVGHRSAPIGTRTVAYGPVILDTQSGRAVTVPGFLPEMAVDSQVFGELDERDVGVGADGEPVDVPEGAEIPRGLLGANAIVVHEDHLYAISPQQVHIRSRRKEWDVLQEADADRDGGGPVHGRFLRRPGLRRRGGRVHPRGSRGHP